MKGRNEMDLNGMSDGQIVYYSGIILIGLSIVALIIGVIAFAIKRKSLKAQLTDKYGF